MADLHPEVEKLLSHGPQFIVVPLTDTLMHSRHETTEEFARRIALRQQELEREECANECAAEFVGNDGETLGDEDEAYNQAIRDCISAIRRRGEAVSDTPKLTMSMFATREEYWSTRCQQAERENADLRAELNDLRVRVASRDIAIGTIDDILEACAEVLGHDVVLGELPGELAALRAELEAVRKDAERYRWLRDNIGYTFDETTATAFLLMPRKQELTAYIDAAIAQGKGEK